MTLVPRNLLEDSAEAAKLRITATDVQSRTFAESADDTPVVLAPGTLVSYNTSTNLWEPWVTGGANNTGVIRGIVWPRPVTILASGEGEAVGNVMLQGQAHYEDLSSLAGSLAQRIAAMRVAPTDAAGNNNPTLRELGIRIEGLQQIR